VQPPLKTHNVGKWLDFWLRREKNLPMTDKLPLLLIVLLIWLGWNEPFSVRYERIKDTITGKAVQQGEEDTSAQPASASPRAPAAPRSNNFSTTRSTPANASKPAATPTPRSTSGSFQNSATLKGGGATLGH